MRSSWKLKPVEFAFQRSSKIENVDKVREIKLWSKGTRIFSDLLERDLQVYNGLKFINVQVKMEMLGFFIGSFVLSKRITSDIHHKTKRNKRGRQKKKKK